MPDARATVVVVQRRLTHYRVPFFEALRPALQRRGYALRLVVGDPSDGEKTKGDGGVLAWAEHAPCRYLLGDRLCWQDLRPWRGGADFMVVTQENKLLANWALLLSRRRRPRVALWGHGRDFQPRHRRWGGASQHLKAWLSRRADWWFAYTGLSTALVAGFGFPAQRITTLDNAVDTAALRAEVLALRGAGLQAQRAALGLGEGPVALVLGSIYADKRLDLVLEAARRLAAARPGFRLLVAGGGPDAARWRDETAGLAWVCSLGPVQGRRKAEALALADLMLSPGAVGVGILEAFACELPVIAAETGRHGPEIAYLEPGVNGLLVAPDAGAIAAAADALLSDGERMARLREGCRASAGRLTLQAMVEHFCDGVEQWAAARPRR